MKPNWIRLITGCISIFILLISRSPVFETEIPQTVISTNLTPAAPQTIDSPVNVKTPGRTNISDLRKGADSPTAPLDAGVYQWHTFYGSPSNESGLSIAVDNYGGVYITGCSFVPWDGPDDQVPLKAFSGQSDIFVLKLDATGTYQWHTFYGDNARGTGITMDSNGGVYISGLVGVLGMVLQAKHHCILIMVITTSLY